MPAAVPVCFSKSSRCTAAGLTELFWGHAFITVAAAARAVTVLLSAGTGVRAGNVVISFTGKWLVFFLHGFTKTYGSRTIITHMRINHLKDCIQADRPDA
jgi:hypothetical protein